MPRKTKRIAKLRSRDSTSDDDISYIFKDSTNLHTPNFRMSLRKNRKRKLFFDEKSPLSDKTNNTPCSGKENKKSAGKQQFTSGTPAQTSKGAPQICRPQKNESAKTCIYRCRFSEVNRKSLRPEEKLALYDFPFNENDVPKKRRRKPVSRKPKVGSKAGNRKNNVVLKLKDDDKCVPSTSKSNDLSSRTDILPSQKYRLREVALKEDEIRKLAEEPLDTVNEMDEDNHVECEDFSIEINNLSNGDINNITTDKSEKAPKRIPFHERIKKFNISLESPPKTSPKSNTFHTIKNKTVYCSTPNNTDVKPKMNSQTEMVDTSSTSLRKSLLNRRTSRSSPPNKIVAKSRRSKSSSGKENAKPPSAAQAPSHSILSSTPYMQNIKCQNNSNMDLKRETVLAMAMSTVNRIRRTQKSLYVGPTPFVNFHCSLENSFMSNETPEQTSELSCKTLIKDNSVKSALILPSCEKVSNIPKACSETHQSPVHLSESFPKDKNSVSAKPALTEEKTSSISAELKSLIEMKSAEEEIARCFGFTETDSETKENPYLLHALQQRPKPWRVNFANVRFKNSFMSLSSLHKSYLRSFHGDSTSYTHKNNISICSSIDSFSMSNILSLNQSNISVSSVQTNALEASSNNSVLDKDKSKLREISNSSYFKEDAFKKPSLPPSRSNSIQKYVSASGRGTKQEESQSRVTKNVPSRLFRELNNPRDLHPDYNQRTLDELYISFPKNNKDSSHSGKNGPHSWTTIPNVDCSETATSDFLDETSASSLTVMKPRRSYARKKRRRMLQEEVLSDEEGENKEIQSKKKKTNKKEKRMIDEWARNINSELQEADSFELCVE